MVGSQVQISRHGLINVVPTKTPDSVTLSHWDELITIISEEQSALDRNNATFISTRPKLTPIYICLTVSPTFKKRSASQYEMR